MIVSYRDSRTERFARGRRVKAFDGIRRKAEMKLDQLDAATDLRDLNLPGNRLEILKGDRQGQYSIRIDHQWRLCLSGPTAHRPRERRIGRLPLKELSMPRIAIHPGEHLAEQLGELGMSAAELGRRLGVPTNRITAIINGQRAVTGDTALRLGHFFGVSPEFWLNLQLNYDLRVAEAKNGKQIRSLPKMNLARHVRRQSKTA